MSAIFLKDLCPMEEICLRLSCAISLEILLDMRFQKTQSISMTLPMTEA